MPKKISYTQLTLKRLRKNGIKAAVIEKWNQNVRRGDGGFGIRQDLFGWIDIIALDPTRGIIGIQSTSAGALSAHLSKMLNTKSEEIVLWSRCRGITEIWAWRKEKNLWVVDITLLP